MNPSLYSVDGGAVINFAEVPPQAWFLIGFVILLVAFLAWAEKKGWVKM